MDCRIKIVDGINSGGFKELAALAVEEYLESRLKDAWTGSDVKKDLNSEDTASYLEEVLPEGSPWVVNSSQSAFDIYSISCRVAIELKSQKSNNQWVVGNATIYPTEALVREIVPIDKQDPLWSEELLDSMMDVLVVFVDGRRNTLNNFSIVDGSYWGVEHEDFTACHDLFREINSPALKKDILKLILDRIPNQRFVKRLLSDQYNGKIRLNLRKLITYQNPTKEALNA